MRRKAIMIASTMAMVMSMSTTALAAGWQSDNTGWWWEEDDGSYPVSDWREIYGKWYYFGQDGYMFSNTVTPDGYRVGADGALILTISDELPITPYRDIPWDISWIKFSRNTMVDHGNYYELPNQTLCYTYFDEAMYCDEYAEIYTGSAYLYKNATYKLNDSILFSSVEECLNFIEQHPDGYGYDNGCFQWMFWREGMDEKGYFTEFYPNWAG